MTKNETTQANLKHLIAQMVLNQREKPLMNTVPIPGILDYAVGGSAMDLANAALDEAIPNGQKLRVEFAANASVEGLRIVTDWLRAKGYDAPVMYTDARPYILIEPTEAEAGIFAEALESCYKISHPGGGTFGPYLAWDLGALADLMETCVWVHTRPVGPHILLDAAEIQSKHDRVKWAEGLIRQLPVTHEGRNSWLMNYGEGPADAQAYVFTGDEEGTLNDVGDRATTTIPLDARFVQEVNDTPPLKPLETFDINSWDTKKRLMEMIRRVDALTVDDRMLLGRVMVMIDNVSTHIFPEISQTDLPPAKGVSLRAIRNEQLANEYGPEPGQCGVAKTPIGWSCTRAKGHEGPCATVVIAYDPRSELEDTARLQWIVKELSPDQLADIGVFPFADETDLEHLRQVVDDARRKQPGREPRMGFELKQDSDSIDRFAAAIKQRMFEKSKLGYKGWREADNYDLVNNYHRHSVGGNSLDAAAYLMMVWEKGVENLPLFSPSAMRYRFEDDLLNLTQTAQSVLDNGDARHQWVSAMERCRTTFNIGILTSCELRRRTRGWWGKLVAKLQGE